MSTASKTQTQAPRIMVIYTGGTIGMIEDAKSGALVPFRLTILLKMFPKLDALDMNSLTTSSTRPLTHQTWILNFGKPLPK